MKKNDVSGVLFLDKSLGLSSNQALTRIKRLLQAKKAGHTGSLDPLATGLLPLCFGEATKFAHYLLNADKTYRVVGTLGEKTATGDVEGDVIASEAIPPNWQAKLAGVLEALHGEQMQVPPKYSALKMQGKKYYELARAGVEFERPARPIVLHDLHIDALSETTFTLRVRCSKGTYIRTLVEDIAEGMGTVGHVSYLRRLGVADFDEDLMQTEAAIAALENPLSALWPVDTLLRALPKLTLTLLQADAFSHGQRIDYPSPHQGMIRVYREDGVFLGLAQGGERLQPHRLVSRTATGGCHAEGQLE